MTLREMFFSAEADRQEIEEDRVRDGFAQWGAAQREQAIAKGWDRVMARIASENAATRLPMIGSRMTVRPPGAAVLAARTAIEKSWDRAMRPASGLAPVRTAAEMRTASRD